MSLYGDHNVELNALKAWAKELDEDTIMGRLPQAGIYGEYATDTICRNLLPQIRN